MIRETITPRVRAQPAVWGTSTRPTMLDDEAARGAIALRELEQNAGRRPGELSPDVITVPADLSALMLATHPMRNRVPFDPVAIETSALLSIALADAQARIIEKTARSRATTQRGCFRTFHIDARASIDCARAMLSPIIQHEWMAVAGHTRDDIAYAQNTPGHWIGNDATGAITSSDMRRWTHALSEHSKRLDLIVSAHDPVGSMVFALSALSENGCAVIRLDGLRPDTVAATYVFAQYFTRTEYVHSMATDASWIIGITRMVAPNARVKRELGGWIDANCRGYGAPFSDETMCSPAVLEVARALHRADSAVRQWREARYRRVLDVVVPVDMGRAIVEDLLAHCAVTFPDWS